MRRQIVATAVALSCLFSLAPDQALGSDREDVIAEFSNFNKRILDAKRLEDLPNSTPQDFTKISEELRPVLLSRAKSNALNSIRNVHVLELEGHYARLEGTGLSATTDKDGKEKQEESKMLLALRKLKDGWDVMDFETQPLNHAPSETDPSPNSKITRQIMNLFSPPVGRVMIETVFTVKEDGTVSDIKSSSYPKNFDAETAVNDAVRISAPLLANTTSLKDIYGKRLKLPAVGILSLETVRECSESRDSYSVVFYQPGEQPELSTEKELSEYYADTHKYKEPSSATNEELAEDLENLTNRGQFSKAVPYALEVYRRIESQSIRKLNDKTFERALSSTTRLTRELMLMKEYVSAERIAEAKLRLAETWHDDLAVLIGLSELTEVYILMGKVDEANETVEKFVAKLRAQAKEIEAVELTRVKPGSEKEFLKQMIILRYGLDPKGTMDKSDPDLKKQAANNLRVSNFLRMFESRCQSISVAYLKKCEDQKFDAFTEETKRIKDEIKWNVRD